MMKQLFFFTLFSLIAVFGYSQTRESKYTTAAITPIMVKFDEYDDLEWGFEEGFEGLDLSSKYFNNDLNFNIVGAKGKKKLIQSFSEEIERYTPKETKLTKRVVKGVQQGVAAAMIGEKALLAPEDSLGLVFGEILQSKFNIGKDILKLWSEQDSEGNFTVLNQRSASSLTTTDLTNEVDYQKLDAFKDLFYKNYIFLFDFGDIQNAQRYMDKYPSNAGVSAHLADYVVEVNTYVYKLDINDGIFQEIKKNFRKGDFGSTPLPIKYVGRYLSVAESGSTNNTAKANETPEMRKQRIYQTHKVLAQKAYDEIIELAEMRIEDFKVRTKVTSGFPNKVRAEIGLNENVKLDQRYFAYENQLDEASGVTTSVLKGVLRVAEITDNISNLKEDSGEFKDTRFYQVWGDPVKEGMFLVQENDFGVGVGAGLRTLRNLNFNFRVEYRISEWLKRGWKTSPLVNTNVYADIYFTNATIDADLDSEIVLSTGIGVSSKFYISKWVKPEPYIGYYLMDGFTFLNLGVRFDYPISHKVYLVPELGLSTAKSKNENFSPIVLGLSIKSEL